MILILLSAACSVILAHLLKSAETRRLSTINVLTVNYLTALLAAISLNVYSGKPVIPDFPLWFVLFAGVVGCLFIINFFIFSKSVDRNGLGVTIASMRVSLLIPILVSVLVYGEILNLRKVSGIIIVFLAMGFFITAKKTLDIQRVSHHLLLIALFVITGLVDSSLKVFEREMLGTSTEAHFMTALFVVAFITGLTVSFWQGEMQKITSREIFYGALVGVPNLFSSIFLIKALSIIDASAAYSLVNLLVITGGTMVGIIIWKDKVTPKEWAGLVLALLAIVLLGKI